MDRLEHPCSDGEFLLCVSLTLDKGWHCTQEAHRARPTMSFCTEFRTFGAGSNTELATLFLTRPTSNVFINIQPTSKTLRRLPYQCRES